MNVVDALYMHRVNVVKIVSITMTDVASLENSRRLFEVSGWCGFGCEHHGYYQECKMSNDYSPAYSAGYLLRKLPRLIKNDKALNMRLELLPLTKRDDANNLWMARYSYSGIHTESDTPEDALCLLAIKLFEEGVLVKGES